jgi:hypothetical protein
MSLNICYSTLLLICTIFVYVSPQDAIRQYIIRKDSFSGIKSGEFSIYDTTEQNMHYRIESEFNLLQSIKVVAYPSKQIVGRLEAQLKPLLFKADIIILDPTTNQWTNGLIQQNFKVLGSSFNIDWNGHRIIMENEVASLSSKFRDVNGDLFAEFKMQHSSILRPHKYDMQIFSNKYPEQIYLLALAVRDHLDSKNIKRG